MAGQERLGIHRYITVGLSVLALASAAQAQDRVRLATYDIKFLSDGELVRRTPPVSSPFR